ncbi:MAG: protein translocase subunit SecD, partial [Smithellaceae bacterium]|nr:protein translocase subunit SecD [Smithellaceae bacterium]
MLKSLQLRAAIAAVVCIAAVIFLIPSLAPELPDFWKQYLPIGKIPLGLDLQGGTHLVLEVDTAKAVESSLNRTVNNMKDSMMDKRIRFRNVSLSADGVISLELPDAVAKDPFEKLVGELYPDLEITSSSVSGGVAQIQLRMKPKRINDLKKLAVEQSVETIRNRVDQFGIAEPEIIPEGEDRIVIQLPGIKDTERAKNLIGKTALLEFKMVDDEHSLEQALQGNIPEGDVIAYGESIDRQTGRRTGGQPYLLKDKPVLTGDSLESAQVKISDRFGEPYVAIKFNAQGARDFERVTTENVKKRLAIVLDGQVHSAPVIQEPISGGQAQITGTFTMDEAKDLAIVLRAGALPAPVNILEERTVGPSLGQDSIEKGIWSGIIGTILVVFFMVFYYKFSGLIADLALILNMVILGGVLAAFHATLTLPGIAGIVLIIGMSVDANVLIFERIREELRSGKTPRAAIETGYDRAFLTIL